MNLAARYFSVLICFTSLKIAGKTGQEAFIITENDEVFACGLNYSCCLGLGKEGPQIEPTRVPELCFKNVIGKLAACIRSRNKVIRPTEGSTKKLFQKPIILRFSC